MLDNIFAHLAYVNTSIKHTSQQRHQQNIDPTLSRRIASGLFHWEN